MLLIFLKFCVLTFLLSASPSFFPLLVCFSFLLMLLRLCISTSPASGCSQRRYRPVVWFCSRSSSMRWPAERQPASHQLQRWSDCFFFFLSAHLIGPMTHYLHTLNFSAAVISFAHLDKHQLWSANVLSGNLRYWTVKNLCRYFFCHEKDDKSEQGGLLSSILKYREPSSIHRLCHRSFTHLQLLTVSEVNQRSASDSVFGLDWWSLSAQLVKDTLDLFSLHRCD